MLKKLRFLVLKDEDQIIFHLIGKGCMFCDKLATINALHLNQSQIKSVTTLPLHSKFLSGVIRKEMYGLLKFKYVFMAALI